MGNMISGIEGDDWVLLGATLVSVAGSYAVHELASKKNKSTGDKVVRLILIAVATWICGLAFSKYVLDKEGVAFLERYRFEMGIEGTWMESYTDTNGVLYYAVATITFNRQLKEVSTTGNVFDPKGKWLASWNSTMAYCEPQKGRLTSTYEGNVPGQDVARGYSLINFHTTADTITTGTGSFADQHTNGRLQTFLLERVSPTDCKLLCGEGKPLTELPQGQLVRRYHGRKEMEHRRAANPTIGGPENDPK